MIYLLVGVIGGGLLVAIIFFLTRRGGNGDDVLLSKIELLERAQEREERVLREEMSRKCYPSPGNSSWPTATAMPAC